MAACAASPNVVNQPDMTSVYCKRILHRLITRKVDVMSYARFAAMILVSTVVMFILMYLNTYEVEHIFYSQTRTWMAIVMGAAMAIIMMLFMTKMYGNNTVNIAILIGGAVVFVASKNGLAASPNASAYCTAKAAEIHLARCLALEGAEAGIRVNVINPDAVLRGSRIWEGEWLDQRASTYGTDKEGLEEMYRKRSLLKRSVLPEDIAEGVYFLTSDLSAKSTGNILNVDAGNVQSFTR